MRNSGGRNREYHHGSCLNAGGRRVLGGFSIKLSAGSSRVWWPAPVLHSLLGSGIDLSAVGLAENLGHDRSSACFSLMKMTRPDEQEVCRSWPLMTRKYFQADLGVEDRYLLNGKIIFNMDLECFNLHHPHPVYQSSEVSLSARARFPANQMYVNPFGGAEQEPMFPCTRQLSARCL